MAADKTGSRSQELAGVCVGDGIIHIYFFFLPLSVFLYEHILLLHSDQEQTINFTFISIATLVDLGQNAFTV